MWEEILKFELLRRRLVKCRLVIQLRRQLFSLVQERVASLTLATLASVLLNHPRNLKSPTAPPLHPGSSRPVLSKLPARQVLLPPTQDSALPPSLCPNQTALPPRMMS